MSLDDVFALLEKAGIFAHVDSKGISSKDGSLIRTYDVNFDKSSIIKTMVDLVEKYNVKHPAKDTESLPAVDVAKAQKALEDAFKDITFDPLHLEIGVIDGKLHVMRNGIGVILPKDLTSSAPKNISSMVPSQFHIGFEVAYSDFGKKFSISAPTESQSLMTLVNSSMSSAREKGNDARIKTYLSQVRASAEMYYDKGFSYAGFCTKDLSTQKSFVSITQYSGTTPQCFDSSKAYAVSSILGDKKNYCVDSTGAAITTDTKLTGTVCKK